MRWEAGSFAEIGVENRRVVSAGVEDGKRGESLKILEESRMQS